MSSSMANLRLRNVLVLLPYIMYAYNKKKSKMRVKVTELDPAWSEVTQLCPTLCGPIDYSLLGSSVHGIFQAIVLEWIAISFSRGSSQPRDRTRVSRIVDRCFTVWGINSKLTFPSYIPTTAENLVLSSLMKLCNSHIIHWPLNFRFLSSTNWQHKLAKKQILICYSST